MGKEKRSPSDSRHYPAIFMEGLRKNDEAFRRRFLIAKTVTVMWPLNRSNLKDEESVYVCVRVCVCV
jgi:hypothetical protein